MEKWKKSTLGICGVFGFMVSMAWAAGSVRQNENLPTDQLTLAEPGCQYLVQIGIGIDVKSGICSVNVKFRKNHWNDGGEIVRTEGQPIVISAGQVVAIKELDDGSNDPWTLQLWLSFAWFLGSAMAMAGSAILLKGKLS